MDIMAIGISAKLHKVILGWQFLVNICHFLSKKILLKQSILMRGEFWQCNLKIFIWWVPMYQMLVKSSTGSIIELKTGINVSNNICKNLKRKKQPFCVETWMSVISKLISQGQKEMKEQQDLQLRKDKVSVNFWKMVGSILLGTFTLKLSSIHGGACEQEEEPKTLVGDLIILLSTKKP